MSWGPRMAGERHYWDGKKRKRKKSIKFEPPSCIRLRAAGWERIGKKWKWIQPGTGDIYKHNDACLILAGSGDVGTLGN